MQTYLWNYYNSEEVESLTAGQISEVSFYIILIPVPSWGTQLTGLSM